MKNTVRNTQNLNKTIISLFSPSSPTVTIPKLYIDLTGSYSTAAVLNQCVYWSNKSSSKDGWFYKSYDDWFEEINIPERTLRRRFDYLEQMGWITTKIKKVFGLNIKHIKPNIHAIIASLSSMLNIPQPAYTLPPDHCPPPNCSKVIPTGQLGRMEPATLSDSSIYTEEDSQKNKTNCERSSSFVFSETLDQNILSQKLHRDERTDEEFMEHVVEHVENHSDKKYSRIVRAQGVLKLLQKLKSDNVIFYVTGKEPTHTQIKTNTPPPAFTPEELDLAQGYKHALKMQARGFGIEVFIPKAETRIKAKAIYERMQAMEGEKSCTQKTIARNGSLKSVSSLVSHLISLQRDS